MTALTSKGHGLGWTRDLPDQRDQLFLPEPVALPTSVSLRDEMPPVYDQGQLGSCTANSIAAILEFNEMRQRESTGTPSRLFIYYNERALEGTVKSDSGAQIRDGIKVVATIGAPPETVWPYVIRKFATKPSKKAYNAATRYEALSYGRVPQATLALQTVLASRFPVSFGFTVYESFETEVGSNGIVPMPEPGETVEGGHAVVITGYQKIEGHLYFEVRNSWSAEWGKSGYCFMPAAYITDPSLASDFWVIRQVTEEAA